MLVTEGDNVAVVATVRALARGGYEPWVAAARRTAPGLRCRATAGSAIVADPAASRDAFIRDIVRLARIITPVAILPGGERGLIALADLAETGGGAMAGRIAVCSRAVVHRATDKEALGELARQAGLAVPETVALTAEAATRGPLPLDLPAIVKPPRSQIAVRDGLCGWPVRRARTRDEVVAALRALPGGRGLLQRYHPGRLTGVGGVFWDGRIVSSVHQRAERTFPVDCGEMSCAVAIPRDPDLEAGITRLLGAIGWRGLFQLQFLETEAGRLLIDLNPRVYGSLALALAAGQNLPTIWADLLCGRPVRAQPYRTGVSFRNELLDARALLASARTGRRREVLRRAPARASAYAYFEAGDPMPLLSLGPALASKLGPRVKRGAGARVIAARR